MQLIFLHNPEQAERWADALDDAGIDVFIEITDAREAWGSSPLVGVLGARPMEFVHALTIHPEDRERALAVLVDAGWDGREGSTLRPPPNIRGMLTAMGYTVAGIGAFLLVRWLAS